VSGTYKCWVKRCRWTGIEEDCDVKRLPATYLDPPEQWPICPRCGSEVEELELDEENDLDDEEDKDRMAREEDNHEPDCGPEDDDIYDKFVGTSKRCC